MPNLSHEEVQTLFKNLEVNKADEFFKRVSEKVYWTVMGTHPLAGEYHDKESFLNATFRRLNKILNEGVVLTVTHVYVDGNVAIVEMKSLSTAKNNKPFNNRYCWVVEFDEYKMITTVRAYLDSALVQRTVDENER